MRAAAVLLGVASVSLGAVRLWLLLYRPAPRTFRGRVLRVLLDVVLVVVAVVVVVVLVVVAVGVVREVAGNV